MTTLFENPDGNPPLAREHDPSAEPELSLVQAVTRILIAVLVTAAILAVINRLADAHFDLGKLDAIDDLVPTDPIAISSFTA